MIKFWPEIASAPYDSKITGAGLAIRPCRLMRRYEPITCRASRVCACFVDALNRTSNSEEDPPTGRSAVNVNRKARVFNSHLVCPQRSKNLDQQRRLHFSVRTDRDSIGCLTSHPVSFAQQRIGPGDPAPGVTPLDRDELSGRRWRSQEAAGAHECSWQGRHPPLERGESPPWPIGHRNALVAAS